MLTHGAKCQGVTLIWQQIDAQGVAQRFRNSNPTFLHVNDAHQCMVQSIQGVIVIWQGIDAHGMA